MNNNIYFKRQSTTVNNILPPKKYPLVSIIIPCRNEEKYIYKVLKQCSAQEYKGKIEIIIVDAMSTDATHQKIKKFQHDFPKVDLKIIKNKKIHIPVGLNMGIKKAKGDIIIRIDGHAIPEKNYVTVSVQTLQEGYDIVGGICITKQGSDKKISKLIALALSHPFGVGDSHFRLCHRPQKKRLIDTIPFGAFYKKTWETLQGFNEKFIVHQDYEFNYRARKIGKTILLNPDIISYYYARTSLKKLWNQFHRYGQWKFSMLINHPKSLRFRHLIPFVFVVSLILLSLFSLLYSNLLILLGVEITLYIIASFMATINICYKHSFSIWKIFLPFIFFIMHFSYGLGILMGAIKSIFSKKI